MIARSAPRWPRLLDAVGTLVAVAARGADAVLERGGLTPPRLELTPEALADLRGVFGTSLDPTSVVIRRGHWPGVPHPRAFAVPGLVYLGADPGIVRGRATPTLVHELVHLWQGRHLGAGYVAVALYEQVRWGRRAYDWRWHLDRAGSGGTWRDLPVEAHAQLLTEAYRVGATAGGRPARSVSSVVSDEEAFGTPARRRVLDEALLRLRRGR